MSDTKVWWQCAQGHEWQSKINNRAHGNGCPKCASDHTRSAPEIALVDSLIAWLGQKPPLLDYAIPGLRWPSGYTVTPDFCVNGGAIKLVVEYDGNWFHGTSSRAEADQAKTRMMLGAGFIVIRIRESSLPVLDPDFDLVLEHSLIYQSSPSNFQYLTQMARCHIDEVCRREFGETTWNRFLKKASLYKA